MACERCFTLTVRYAETDAQGVVHHANYLTWFEEGRSELLRQKGMHYSDIERAGFFVVVAHAAINYRAPAFYEDRVTVTTSLEKIHRRILEFAYRAVNQDGMLLAEGRTVHVVIGKDRRPTSLPPEWMERLSAPEEG
ncbi:MAG: acyl-CoA thioesterase [Desulfuromonadaceae bacterium]|nr:acyl-CoA thioesterase [Desulfuromonadaceae bacterium]